MGWRDASRHERLLFFELSAGAFLLDGYPPLKSFGEKLRSSMRHWS